MRPDPPRHHRQWTRSWIAIAAIAPALSSSCASSTASSGRGKTLANDFGMGHPQPRATALPITRQDPDLKDRLPESVEGFSRQSRPHRIDGSMIFDYMDGAGELYLAYRFDHLDVITYSAGTDDDILVELYWMGDTDDAFGLLSTDWGGEPLAGATAGSDQHRFPTALYGAGLLRLASDRLYARVLASQESDASASAVMALGKAILTGTTMTAPPLLVAALPAKIAGLRLRSDSVCFFRSHLVLNSAYFLSQKDILDLGHDVDAVTARFDATGAGPAQRVRLVLARYPDAQRARQALANFRQAYLPETQRGQGVGELTAITIEDGWAACQVRGAVLALALQAADRDVAAACVAAGLDAASTLEKHHE
jgi:hypothetical protein